MSKVLYVATVVKTHIMEFHIPYLKMLKEMGWDTAVAARNDYVDPDECEIPYCDSYYDIKFERNPFNPGNIRAYKQLKRIIDEGDYDIIHCHTPVGGCLTRLAASVARKKGSKVIYTAHGFHFYKGAPLLNWLLYYPVERFLARLTDVLVTINREDYERAKGFRAKKVHYIHGVGVDTERFRKDAGKLSREDLGIPQDAVVLLSVGEVNKNKNHGIVIEALKDFPQARYVLCGDGPLLEDRKKLAENLGLSEKVHFLGYRNDVSRFYHMADVFVFPSFREGLPVSLMEAMASGVVCVASRNRGTRDLLPDSRLLFDADNITELKQKLVAAITENQENEIKVNLEHLNEYDLANVLSKMKEIYIEETGGRSC